MAALCSYKGSLNPARALGPAFVANRLVVQYRDLIPIWMTGGGGDGNDDGKAHIKAAIDNRFHNN